MKKEKHPVELLNRREAAQYLKVSPGTLAVWDCTKRYDLKPMKVGRSVRYTRENLDKFMNRNMQF
jgi:hypothetical protein